MLVIPAMTVLCTAGVAFYVRFLVALCKECKLRRSGYWLRLRLGSREARFWSCRGPKDQLRAQHESALKAATLQTNSVSKSVSHYLKTEGPWVIYRFDPIPLPQHKHDQLEMYFRPRRIRPLRLLYELFRPVLCTVIFNTSGWERQPESEMCLNTQKMQKCRLAATMAGSSLVTLVVLICLTSATSLGQVGGQETNIASARSEGSGDHAASDGVPASGNTNAEVLQELERMRVRIQQLESQLRTADPPVRHR